MQLLAFADVYSIYGKFVHCSLLHTKLLSGFQFRFKKNFFALFSEKQKTSKQNSFTFLVSYRFAWHTLLRGFYLMFIWHCTIFVKIIIVIATETAYSSRHNLIWQTEGYEVWWEQWKTKKNRNNLNIWHFACVVAVYRTCLGLNVLLFYHCKVNGHTDGRKSAQTLLSCLKLFSRSFHLPLALPL